MSEVVIWLRERFGSILLWGVSLLVGLGVIQATVLLGAFAQRELARRGEINRLHERIDRLEGEVNDLTERVQRAMQDDLYMEELARRQGFVREDEVIVLPKTKNGSESTR